MEANLCFQTRHFPAMRHHKNVLVHSSVRLPALQANVGPPPGAARVAVVGAGVVLVCAVGAMYWKRYYKKEKEAPDNWARALHLPMHCSSPTSREGGKGGNRNDLPERGIVSIEELPDLLYEICFGTSYTNRLNELIDYWLADKNTKIVNNEQGQTSVLEKKFPKTNPGAHDYELGLVLTLDLISKKEFVKANKICNQLLGIDISKDARPAILSAIINMMLAMESMLKSPNETSPKALEKKLKLVQEAWGKYKSKPDDFKGGPPQIPPKINN